MNVSVGSKENYKSSWNKNAYVNGKWVPALSGRTFKVTNPSNGEVLGEVPDMNDQDAKLAVEAAHSAFQTWKTTTAKERSAILKKWYNLIVQNAEKLAKIITLEMGKPYSGAQAEVTFGSGFVEWFAEEARRAYGDTIPSPVRNKRIVTIKQPVGVCGMITPWNFPLAMITRKASPALAAGCTVVLKPAEDTPFSALALAELAEEAGFPAGTLNIVTSSRDNASGIGQVLCCHELISKVSFTGSTATGKILLKQAAAGVRRVSLELGGNAAFIVFDSADLEKAVQGAMAAKFRNSGQSCICADRFMVQEGIYEKFLSAFSKAMDTIKVGDGFAEGVNLGPLINEKALNKIESVVSDAKAKGATVLRGGQKLGGTFYEPTILTEVTQSMKCWTQENFGPVVPVAKFRTEEEVIAMMNASSVGLAGYFFSSDVNQCWRIAEKIETGMVGVNDGLLSLVEAPFGGVKESGLGREGSKYGLDEFMEVKYICFGGMSSL